MYHDDPIINDLVLTIINDGNGSQCGMTYQQRLSAAETGIFEFRAACREYNRQRVKYGSKRATREQILTAATMIQKYYREEKSFYKGGTHED